jgi:hypothetical protein
VTVHKIANCDPATPPRRRQAASPLLKLRFGRFAMTAPGRRGNGPSSRVADKKRPPGAAFVQQHDLQTKRQRRAEPSRSASEARNGVADECVAFAAA